MIRSKRHLSRHTFIKKLAFSIFALFVLWNGFTFLTTFNDITLSTGSTPTGLVSNPADVITDKEIDKLDSQINKKYCGIETKDGCRFLFAYHLPEQETSSNKHFVAFAEIARRLKRTIVLTNVGRSRIRWDRMLPFEFYYDVETLQKKFPDVRFITQEEFRKWTKERYNKPNAIHARIERLEPINVEKFVKPDFGALKKMKRFDFAFDNSSAFLQLNIGDDSSWMTGEGNRNMLNFLTTTLNSKAEVVLLVHDRKFLIETTNPVPYAKHLTNAAEKVIKKLDKYIAIHWRMERGEVAMMPECAKRLVVYLERLASKTGINNIYLATDYPLLQKPQSDTFHKLGDEHHQAMKILNSSFHLNTWVSTHSLDYLKEYTDLAKPLEDELAGGGLQGILDKLILINANYFISGSKGCCRIRSKYTLRVAEERKRLFKKGTVRIKNIIDRW